MQYVICGSNDGDTTFYCGVEGAKKSPKPVNAGQREWSFYQEEAIQYHSLEQAHIMIANARWSPSVWAHPVI